MEEYLANEKAVREDAKKTGDYWNGSDADLDQPGPDGMRHISHRLERDMDKLRQCQPIDGYENEAAAILVPTAIHDLPVVSLIDTGATLSVISGRLAMILTSLGLAQIEPSTTRAELFGNGKDHVQFSSQMRVFLQLGNASSWFTVQVLDGMRIDCLIGDDILRALQVNIDYGQRSITAGNCTLPWYRRGEVIWTSLFVEDCHRYLIGATSSQ